MKTWLFRDKIETTKLGDTHDSFSLGPLRLGVQFSLPCPRWVADCWLWWLS